MIPTDIGPHPDAPDYYFPMGKPKSWNDEDCGTLCIRRVGATADMLTEPAARIVRQELPSGEDIYPAYQSEWVMTEEERTRLRRLLDDEAPIALRMLVSGTGLPPVALWLKSEGEV